MITDKHTLGDISSSPKLSEQDPNLWIPKADEAQRDAAVFLPRILAAILDGVEARDWNRYKTYANRTTFHRLHILC